MSYEPGITNNPGLNLKKLRYRMGLSQKDFAKLFNRSHAAISQWELNVYPIDYRLISTFIALGKKHGFKFVYKHLRID